MLEHKSKVGSGRTCQKKSRKQFSQKGFVQDPEFKLLGFLFICLVIPNRVPDIVLNERVANFLCEGPHSKCFRFCRPIGKIENII